MASNLKLVHKVNDNYPDPDRETVRPFRLWDARENCYVAHRFYATERRALDSALLLIRWEQVGRSIEVLDMRTSKWLATYTRKVHTIAFDQRDSDQAILARSAEQ